MRQRKPGYIFLAGARIYCSILLGIALSALILSAQAHADGGAPNLAYVAGARQGVGMIDVAQQKVTRNFAVAGDPNMLLLSPDGSLLYVTQPQAGSITALAAKTGQVICSASFPGHPALLALSIDATTLYVAGIDETSILVLNAQTCVQQRSFQAPGPVHWLAATVVSDTSGSLQTQLWVAEVSGVSILSDQGQVLDGVSIAGEPRFLSLPGALTAYVATRQGSVIAIDMPTHRVIGTLLTGGDFGSMDYNAVTGQIYVPDQQRRQIDVLSPVLAGTGSLPPEPAQVLLVDGSPRAIAITNDGQLGFVALGDGRVAMLDIPGRSIVKTISVGGSPRFIITGVYPPPNVPVPQSPGISTPGLLVSILAVVALIGILIGVIWFLRLRKKGLSLSSPTDTRGNCRFWQS